MLSLFSDVVPANKNKPSKISQIFFCLDFKFFFRKPRHKFNRLVRENNKRPARILFRRNMEINDERRKAENWRISISLTCIDK